MDWQVTTNPHLTGDDGTVIELAVYDDDGEEIGSASISISARLSKGKMLLRLGKFETQD